MNISTYRQFVTLAYSSSNLSQEDESKLIIKTQNGCQQSATTLIMSHLKYIISIARECRGYALPEEDLVQSGIIGLLKAIKGFKHSFEVRLCTYASHFIKAEIFEYVLANWNIVRLATTGAQRKLFFNIRSMTNKVLQNLNANEVQEVSSQLNVDTKDVVEMCKRLSLHQTVPIDIDDHDEAVFQLPCQSPSPEFLCEDASTISNLYSNINKLNDRLQFIIKNRYLTEPPATFQDLSTVLGVSLQRVKQLEDQALKKLKELL